MTKSKRRRSRHLEDSDRGKEHWRSSKRPRNSSSWKDSSSWGEGQSHWHRSCKEADEKSNISDDEEADSRSYRLPDLLVSVEGPHGDVPGVQVLLGRYEATGQTLSRQPVYQKVEAEQSCCLFFWESNGQQGWWFSNEVGSRMVYCYSTSQGFPPPAKGWRLPSPDHPLLTGLHVACLDPSPAVDGDVRRFMLNGRSGSPLGMQLIGTYIQQIQPGSPADDAGVPIRGSILAVNGRKTSDVEVALQDLASRPLILDVQLPAIKERPMPRRSQSLMGKALPSRSDGLPALPATPMNSCPPPARLTSWRDAQREAGLVKVMVPEGAARRASVLLAGMEQEEIECVERLLKKVASEKDTGQRVLWSQIQDLAA